MIITKKPEIAKAYIARIQDLMMGRRVMGSIEYKARGDGIHLSDLNLCPLPAYFYRTSPVADIPPDAAMRFLRGRVVERAIGQEATPVVRDRITCTVDDDHPEYGIAEIKSTAEGNTFFRPEKEHPDWVERMKGYCHAWGREKINLIVFFMVGNMQDYMFWAVKKNGGRPEKYCGIDMVAWELQFTEQEIADNWVEMLRRRDILEAAVAADVPIPMEEVNARRPEWMCKGCTYNKICHAFVASNYKK